MTIIAERGLFVPLLVQSGKFEAAAAEALVLVDALDPATREPATKADFLEVRNELKEENAAMRTEIAAVRTELKLDNAALRTEVAELRKDMQTQSDKLVIKLGGVLVVLFGLAFAALRLL
jgi:hypothetical protein